MATSPSPAYDDCSTRSDVDASQMLVFAVVGLVANLVSIGLLAARRAESLNMRGAYLEVLGDAAGSAAAIVAGLVVLATGFDRADSIASLLIAVLILPRAWSLLRDCLHVLLESAPPGVDVEVVRQHLVGAEGVTDVHDLHAWSITSGMPALSAHVTVTDEALATRGCGPDPRRARRVRRHPLRHRPRHLPGGAGEPPGARARRRPPLNRSPTAEPAETALFWSTYWSQAHDHGWVTRVPAASTNLLGGQSSCGISWLTALPRCSPWPGATLSWSASP